MYSLTTIGGVIKVIYSGMQLQHLDMYIIILKNINLLSLFYLRQQVILKAQEGTILPL